MQFGVDNYRHVGGITHFDLLNHPAVYEQIRRWCGAGVPALPRAGLAALRRLPGPAA